MPESGPQPSSPVNRLTLRSLLLAVLLTWLCGFWVRQAEIVALTCQVTESVPAVPAVGVLVLLVLLNPLGARLHRWLRLSRTELLAVYLFVAIAVSVAGCAIVRFLLALLPSAFYFATPENQFNLVSRWLPAWLAPHSDPVILGLFEGADDGRVPWGAWVGPLAVWSVFFLAVWWTMFCGIVLVRRQWIEKERLTFPLLYLPLEMAGEERQESALPEFFRNPVMWIGFGLAAGYNLLNILKAFNPAVVAPGKYFDLGSLFTERPLDAIRPLVLHYRPEMIGFGYLVSTEVSFSVWFFYLLGRAEAVFGRIAGYDQAGFPFEQEQSMGAYLALAFFLVWLGRQHLSQAFGQAFLGKAAEAPRGEPLSYRLAFLGLLAGFLFLCWFCWYAGMALWVAVVYLGLVFAVALVYARIRAETGAPLMWLFPYYQQKKALLYVFGSAPLAPGGNVQTLSILSLLTFLSRGYFPALIGYQIEGLKLSQEARIPPRQMALLILAAVAVGLPIAYYSHLIPYYYHGAGTLRGGIWGTGLATSEFTEIVTFVKTPRPPDVPRTAAMGTGFALASALMVLRMVFLRFPLHPLGFAMCTAYGSLVWWSFFAVWLTKIAVFKLGGVSLYKKLVPGFLGLALGHFFTAGIVWGLLGMAEGEVFQRYGVWFG